jgi:hypothetical protein
MKHDIPNLKKRRGKRILTQKEKTNKTEEKQK